MIAVALAATVPVPVVAAPSPSVAQATIEIKDTDRILGNKNAPITIVEYASLTCPHCASFQQETLPQIKKEWIDSGKARLVFRDFPFDQAALRASMLAQCAGPTRFWGFLDVLFHSQDSWARAADPTAALGKIARVGGMSEQQFQACMVDKDVQNFVVGNRLAGEQQYGVESTPTFFINGRKIVGAQPYAEFQKVLSSLSPS
jgi:protein-disulfide isomerase